MNNLENHKLNILIAFIEYMSQGIGSGISVVIPNHINTILCTHLVEQETSCKSKKQLKPQGRSHGI